MNHSTFFNAKGRISVGIFDFDGNILHPNSKLKFWNKQNEEYEYVGMVEYENNRQKYENTDTYDFPKYFDSHFENLRDFSVYNSNHAGPDILLNDTLHAIEKGELSPSMEYFKNEFLIPGRPAAILTARGHETGNFERVIRLINEKMLSDEEKNQQMENIRNNFNLENKKKREVLDYYFQFVLSYILVSNRHNMKMQNVDNNEKIKRKKAIMLEKYIKEILPFILSHQTDWTKKGAKNLPYAIGFSDDDAENIMEMIDFLAKKFEKGKIPPNYKMRLYYTGEEKFMKNIDTTITRVSKTIYCEKVREKQGSYDVWKIRIAAV